MKKRKNKTLIFAVVFVFVLLSLSFASANIFSDLWGKFTGKVIDAPSITGNAVAGAPQQCISCAVPPTGCSYSGGSCTSCGTLVGNDGGPCTGGDIGIVIPESSCTSEHDPERMNCILYEGGSFNGDTKILFLNQTHAKLAIGGLYPFETSTLKEGESFNYNLKDNYTYTITLDKILFGANVVNSVEFRVLLLSSTSTCSTDSSTVTKCTLNVGNSLTTSVGDSNYEISFITFSNQKAVIVVNGESFSLSEGTSHLFGNLKLSLDSLIVQNYIGGINQITFTLSLSSLSYLCTEFSGGIFQCKEGQFMGDETARLIVKNIEDADSVELSSEGFLVKKLLSPPLVVGSSWTIYPLNGPTEYVNVLGIDENNYVNLSTSFSPKGNVSCELYFSEQGSYSCKLNQVISGSIFVKKLSNLEVELYSENFFIKDNSPVLTKDSFWKLTFLKGGSLYIGVLKIGGGEVVLKGTSGPRWEDENQTKLNPTKSFCTQVKEGISICTLYEKEFHEGISVESISKEGVKLRMGGDNKSEGEVTPLLNKGGEYIFHQPIGSENKGDLLVEILSINPPTKNIDRWSVDFRITNLMSQINSTKEDNSLKSDATSEFNTPQVVSSEADCTSGCYSDGACYPFGYRVNGMYCSSDKTFVTQLGSNLACENSFECGSNLCVNNQCVNQGLFQKILNWFSKLFGGSSA